MASAEAAAATTLTTPHDIVNVPDEEFADAIRKVLDPAVVDADLLGNILINVAPDVRESALARATEQRHALLATADDIVVASDLRYSFACRYVEFKASWIQLNARMAYTTMVSGTVDANVAAEAAVNSYLLHRIEPLIHKSHIRRINAVLLEPIADVDSVTESGADVPQQHSPNGA